MEREALLEQHAKTLFHDIELRQLLAQAPGRHGIIRRLLDELGGLDEIQSHQIVVVSGSKYPS